MVFPEGVEAGACIIFQPRAHLQTVGLDRVQRSQQPVQSGKYAQAVVCLQQVGFGQALRVQPAIDITREQQQGCLRILLAEPLEAVAVEGRQVIRELHQGRQTIGVEPARQSGQRLRLLLENRLRGRGDRGGAGVKIERLGG